MAGMKKERDPDSTWFDWESQAEEIDACGLCTTLFSEGEGRNSCGSGKKSSGGPWRFMTEREFKVHDAMRRLRTKAVRLKTRIRALERALQTRSRPHPVPSPVSRDDTAETVQWEREMADELLEHCNRFARLRAEWKEMDVERLAAQEERMRLLGHIQ